MHRPHPDSALVRVLTDSRSPRNPIGAGFLVSDRHILTCAHVICDALGLPLSAKDKLDVPVFLDFPLLPGHPLVKTAVMKWFPVRESAKTGDVEDIAVLELLPEIPLPLDALPAPLVLSDVLEDRRVRMCGFPKSMDEGDRRDGRTAGSVGTGLIQIDFEVGRRTAAPGFSGTPVWDTAEKAVSGMIVSIHTRDHETSAYMIPAPTLLQAFPELNRLSRPANPYKGLEAFQEKDAPFFFGRETVIRELAETVEKQPFTAVIGASGSGKSSVVLAGLIPKLRKSGKWLIRDFRPKDDPFYHLALCLISLLYKDRMEQLRKVRELSEDFRQAKTGISDIVRMTAQEHPQRLLLFADQFEELFTANPDKALQHRFMDMLLEPLSHSSRPFRFLFTMRADFMSQAVGYSPFAHALDTYKPKILSSMNAEELTGAMEKPAQKLGVKLESGMSERILQDLGNEPGNLPLLEFALTQLWEKQDFRTLTHESYDEIGGVKQALAKHADAVLHERFKPEEHQLARQIFIQLVRPGEGTEDTRQVAFRHQFSAEKWQFVKRLADERLVVTGRNEENGQESLEVVHEALIQNWKPLQEWMNEDRAFRVWQNNLRQSIAEWEKSGKDEGALLRGVRLSDAEEKIKERREELSESEIVFIQCSVDLREREVKKRKIIKAVAGTAIAVFVVVVSVLGIFGYLKSIEVNKQKAVAEQNAEEADKQKTIAEQKGKEANEKLIEARHNMGYVFNRKADKELEKNNFNASKLYFLHSLASFNPAPNNKERAIALGSILEIFDYPIIFSSSKESHHNGSVKSVAFSPDGKTLASGSEDKTVRLWDVLTGKQKAVFDGHTDDVTCVSFSPDGKMLASGSWDKTVRLWDVQTRKEKAVLSGHTTPVKSVNFSPDGKTLASGSWDKTVRLWDLEAGKEKTVLSGHTDSVNSVSFSPDGKTLASGSDDKTVRLWDSETGEEKIKLSGHTDSVRCLAFSPNGKTLASGSDDKTVRLWHVPEKHDLERFQGLRDNTMTVHLLDVLMKKETAVFSGHMNSVSSVSFSPDGKILASGSRDNTVHLWDLKTKNKDILSGHTDDVNSVNFSPDGKILTSGSEDNTIRLWDMETGKEKVQFSGHIFSVSFSPDGRTLASGSFDKTIRLWDLKTGKEKTVLSGHTSYVISVSFSPDGKTLASGSHDNTVRLWDVGTSAGSVTEKAVLSGHTDNVNSVSFSPDGKTLVSGSSDKTVRLWEVQTGKEKTVLSGHTDSVRSVSFSPDGKTLVSGSDDNTVRLWDVGTSAGSVTGKNVLSGHTDSIRSVSFSPDGKTLVSGSSDKTVRLWDLETGKEKTVLSGHTSSVTSVSFSPDGKTLASDSDDKTVRLWDSETGEEKIKLSGHRDSVRCLAFSPDGHTLASGSSDNTVRRWDLSFYNEIKDRQLTDAEIKEAEQMYNLKLVNLDLQPVEPSKGFRPPRWPKTHPFHWLSKAESGDTDAMVELGIIYDRDNDLEKAYQWYSKAITAGSQRAKERMKIFRQWLTLHKEEYPEAYGKYCAEP